MNLEDQVCSLELAKKLKEIGIKQRSMFVWEYYDDQCYAIKFIPYAVVPNEINKFQWFSAFTVAELGEMLPKELESDDKSNPYELCCKWELHYSDNKMWHITYRKYNCENIRDFIIYDENEANARAKMLIYLIENGLIQSTNY